MISGGDTEKKSTKIIIPQFLPSFNLNSHYFHTYSYIILTLMEWTKVLLEWHCVKTTITPQVTDSLGSHVLLSEVADVSMTQISLPSNHNSLLFIWVTCTFVTTWGIKHFTHYFHSGHTWRVQYESIKCINADNMGCKDSWEGSGWPMICWLGQHSSPTCTLIGCLLASTHKYLLSQTSVVQQTETQFR